MSEAREFTTTVEPNLRIFAGHFPDLPILPGTGLVHSVVLPCIREAIPELLDLEGIDSLKFRRPIEPGACLRIAVAESTAGSGVVRFTVSIGGVECASGTLRFRTSER